MRHPCIIKRNHDLKILNGVITKISERIHKNKLFFKDKLIMFIWKIIDLALMILTNGNNIFKNGYKIGFVEIELGILLNSSITVLGDVLFNKNTKEFLIEAP